MRDFVVDDQADRRRCRGRGPRRRWRRGSWCGRIGSSRSPRCVPSAIGRRGSAAARRPDATSCRARRSAPIFVFTKTIVGSCDRRRYLARKVTFSRAGRMRASCEMVCAGPRRDPTCTNTAFGASVSREPHDFFRHRRRKQHRLARLRRRQHLGDLADVGPEAHVHHPVGFVEHEDFELASSRRRLLRMWSSSRPGVATTMSTPALSERSCGPIGTPPYTAALATGAW